METVPFIIDGVWGGFAEAHGILSLADGSLCFEYRTTDTFFGMIQGTRGCVQIPAEAIEALVLTRRWIRAATLLVRVCSIKAIEDLPGASASEVKLRIARRDVAQAQEFLASARLAIAQRRVSRLREQV